MVSGVCATVSGTTTPLRAATIASRRRGHRARIGICPFPEQGLPVFAIRGRHPEVDIWAGDEWRMTCTCPLSPSQTLQAQAGALGDGRLGAGRKLAVSGAALLPPMRPLVSGLRSLSELTKSASPLTQVGRRLAACSSRTALLAPPPPRRSFRPALQRDLRAPHSTPGPCLVDYPVMERSCSRCRLMAPRRAAPEPKPGWTHKRASSTGALAADGSMRWVPGPDRERLLVASSSIARPTSHLRVGQPSGPSLVPYRSS